MKNYTLITAALALGGVAGLTAGAALPHAQARTPGTAASSGMAPTGPATSARLSLLEARVGALASQVQGLQSQVMALRARPDSVIAPPRAGAGTMAAV